MHNRLNHRIMGHPHQALVVLETRPSLRCISLQLHLRPALVSCYIRNTASLLIVKFYSRRIARLLLHPISCRSEGCPSNIKCPDTIISRCPTPSSSSARGSREGKERSMAECAFLRFRVSETWTEYTQTTIRVRFSDRTQLEKMFPSTDKIRSVYAFVRSSLRDDVRSIKFILCPCVGHF
jgi:hypothetical protein